MRVDRARAHDSSAGDDADRVRRERDERAERVSIRALSDGETEEDDVAGHHRGEHVEAEEGDRVDGARREREHDEEKVAAGELAHVSQPAASSSITLGSVERSRSTRVGVVSNVSPCRSMNTVRKPSAVAGRMSWYWLAPTWTVRSVETPARSRKRRQCPGAGL